MRKKLHNNAYHIKKLGSGAFGLRFNEEFKLQGERANWAKPGRGKSWVISRKVDAGQCKLIKAS